MGRFRRGRSRGRKSSGGGFGLNKLMKQGFIGPSLGMGILGAGIAGYLAAKVAQGITLPVVPNEYQGAAKGLLAGGPAGAIGGLLATGGLGNFGLGGANNRQPNAYGI